MTGLDCAGYTDSTVRRHKMRVMMSTCDRHNLAAHPSLDSTALYLLVAAQYGVHVQVRYDRKLSKKTALKFMTDGILLRELQEDFLLSKYSSIVIDEAHERSLNTDLLLGETLLHLPGMHMSTAIAKIHLL